MQTRRFLFPLLLLHAASGLSVQVPHSMTVLKDVDGPLVPMKYSGDGQSLTRSSEMAFSPDGKTLAVGTIRATVLLIETESPQ